MTIPNTIHHSLTAPERIRAAIAAMARGDGEELETLKTTCPKRSFTMNDPAYGEAMERLLVTALAVEADLRGAALDFLVAALLKEWEAGQHAVDEAHAIEAAWGALVAEKGISREDMEKVRPPHHRAVTSILGFSVEEPDGEVVGFILDRLREICAT